MRRSLFFKPWLRVAALLGLGLGLPFCRPPAAPLVVLKAPDGHPLPPPEPANEKEERSARLLMAQAARLTGRGAIAAANRRRDQVLSKYPATEAAADLFAERAKRAVAAGKTTQAIGLFEKLIFYRPTYAGMPAVRAAYSTLLMEVGRFADAANMLQLLYATSQRAGGSVGEQVGFGTALATARQSNKEAGAALELLVELANLPQLPDPKRQELQDQACRLTATAIGFADAQQLWAAHQKSASWAFVAPVLAFKLAKTYYHVRDYAKSEALLEQLGQAYPESPYASSANEFLSFVRSRFTVEAHTLGAVLPLSGRFKLFGERSLQAIELALGPAIRRGALKLSVQDSGGEPALAAQAVETLVLRDHVIAIIGPLFSSEALAAAVKAEEMSVPLLALSHREGLPELGPYVFRTALTVAAQAKALAKVAFERLGFRRFAMLYPKNRYGIDFCEAFWNEVDRRHGEMRGVEAYEPDQTTFRDPVRRLVGRSLLTARPEYKAALDALKEQELSPLRLRAELNRLEKNLPPLVDFEAVVIPDSGRQIGLIAPALAFEDIVLTHDPRLLERIRKAQKRDLQPVTLLGASTWNSSQTLDSCENDCEDAVFVDGYWPQDPQPKVLDFTAGFRELSHGADPLLGEAQAYDTAAWLAQIIAEVGPPTRKDMAESIRQSPPFEGVSGRWSFNEIGEAQRALYVLTIRNHAISPLGTLRGR
jgi:branched-chain amino acid transport system substrate-binding protein